MAVLLQVVTEVFTPPSLQETAFFVKSKLKLGMSQVGLLSSKWLHVNSNE